ncbi:MAG: hydrogenase maturation protease [Chloroflexi bacterium]|nr:hydrogenase maturation protease [Chloroflexota bacterium]
MLVLGLGNVLLQDEGLGIHALERLRAEEVWPACVSWLDGGTKGMDLLPYLDGVTDLLVLDAIDAGQPPGALVCLAGEDIPTFLSPSLSMHQLGLQELLALAALQGILPNRVVLLGLQPECLGWGTALSRPVRQALGDLVSAAALVLTEWLQEDDFAIVGK